MRKQTDQDRKFKRDMNIIAWTFSAAIIGVIVLLAIALV